MKIKKVLGTAQLQQFLSKKKLSEKCYVRYVFDIHAEHGVDMAIMRYPRDPFPTQMMEFKDTQVGTNFTMVAYVRFVFSIFSGQILASILENHPYIANEPTVWYKILS